MDLPTTFTAEQQQLASGGLTEIERLHHAVLSGWTVSLDLDDGRAEVGVWNPTETDPVFPEGFIGRGDTLAAAWLEAIVKAVGWASE
jgi:hypothetical protein